jgi:hypothetical protein
LGRRLTGSQSFSGSGSETAFNFSADKRNKENSSNVMIIKKLQDAHLEHRESP